MTINDDLGFTFEIKLKEVHIYHRGKKATTLRHRKAEEFIDETTYSSDREMQQLMARITGNYKRGNEKLAKQKREARYH